MNNDDTLPYDPRHSLPTATSTTPDLVQLAAVLDLFARVKEIEKDGWGGGDLVPVLEKWFTEFGIDVNADKMAAAQSLRMPARLTHTLTARALDESGLVIHVRADSVDPLGSARAHLAALILDLGEHSSATVFDMAGDQIAHLVHPTAH